MKRKMTESEKNRLRTEHWSWLHMIAAHAIAGMAIGAAFATALMYFDIHRIGSMILNSPHRLGFSFLLTFGFASLFGMVASGTAIWFRAVREDQ